MRSEVLPTATHGKGQWAEQTAVMRLPQPRGGCWCSLFHPPLLHNSKTSIMTQKKKKDVGKVLGAQAILGSPAVLEVRTTKLAPGPLWEPGRRGEGLPSSLQDASQGCRSPCEATTVGLSPGVTTRPGCLALTAELCTQKVHQHQGLSLIRE